MTAPASRPALRTGRFLVAALVLALLTVALWSFLPAGHAHALPPGGPQGPDGPGGADSSVTVDLEGLTDKPGTSIAVLLTLASSCRSS